MRILFLDQTGKLAGAELVLLDIAKFHRHRCLVGLFEDGLFRSRLEESGVPVQVLTRTPIPVRRESTALQGLQGMNQLIPLIRRVVQLSKNYDLIYANTLKALIVGALASFFSDRPFIFHLHDILNTEHFSAANQWLVITLANRFADQVITVSHAARNAFIAAGGRADLIQVIYNGFDPDHYQSYAAEGYQLRHELGCDRQFVVGHFSRLSPWKGQHVLIEALTHCPEEVVALLVGDALFGEEAYVQQLHQQVTRLGLEHRVKFLGFRSDVPKLMAACDLVAHTSTLPEPSSRILVETMLCKKFLIATQTGGSAESVTHGKTGWLVPPNDSMQLAAAINQCHQHPEQMHAIAEYARIDASQRFHVSRMNQQINQVMHQVVMSNYRLKASPERQL